MRSRTRKWASQWWCLGEAELRMSSYGKEMVVAVNMTLESEMTEEESRVLRWGSPRLRVLARGSPR